MRQGWNCLLALCIAFAAPATQAREEAAAEASTEPALETVLALHVDGELDVDAAGAVAAFRIPTPMPAAVRASLERYIAGWRFEPIIEGEALASTTVAMQVALAAREDAGNFRVTIENVRLWAKDAANPGSYVNQVATIAPVSLKPPSYPSSLIDYGLDGKVLVGLLLAPDGSVASASIVQSALYDARGKPENLRKALLMFEKSALAGARRWRFDVVATGVPTPADLTVFVPVQYLWDARRQPSGDKWRTLVRTARTPPAWLPATDDRARLGVADVGGGGVVPAAPRMRLAVDPAGTTL